MKQTLNPVLPVALSGLLLMAPVLQARPIKHKRNEPYNTFVTAVKPAKHFSKTFLDEADSLYSEIDLKTIGLSKQAFEYALKGYLYLLEHHWLNRSDVISICDFSQSSRNKRLYVIDLEQKQVLINTYVAHGRKSGAEYARSFSNSFHSHKSSLGFYVTEKTYYGDHGLSLKIHGLEKGINDKACARNIVVHGSDYIGSDFIKMNKFNGRSFGCPAVPSSEIDEVVAAMKDGTCLFIYYPTKKYIARSKILNS
ncbi:MAG: murein L,D-transpeptidase catalytic domain family protein [Bacteroidetes bacterium]|nr:murein L,D-transpeptidase catalytic domain family protein [Bacteroidota bacterium]